MDALRHGAGVHGDLVGVDVGDVVIRLNLFLHHRGNFPLMLNLCREVALVNLSLLEMHGKQRQAYSCARRKDHEDRSKNNFDNHKWLLRVYVWDCVSSVTEVAYRVQGKAAHKTL
jgi:hypothetical protein